MLTGDQYEQIANARATGEQVTDEQVDALLTTIQKLDLHLAIAQNALQLSIENITVAVPSLAESVMQSCGRTDQKMKKKVADMAASAVANCENSLHTYITSAFLEAARMLGEDIEDFIGQSFDSLVEE